MTEVVLNIGLVMHLINKVNNYNFDHSRMRSRELRSSELVSKQRGH